jgi:hypothetical protein
MDIKVFMASATPGEFYLGIGEQYCFHSGNRVAMCVGTEDGGEQGEVTVAEFWPADNNVDVIDAKLLLHCKKQFMPLLDALEELIEEIDAKGLVAHFATERKARAAIAAAKEVK